MGDRKTHWRCFQCGDVFADRRAAAEHFGIWSHFPPACVQRLSHTDKALFARIASSDAQAHRLYLQKRALELALQQAGGAEAVSAAYLAAEAEFQSQPAAALPLPDHQKDAD